HLKSERPGGDGTPAGPTGSLRAGPEPPCSRLQHGPHCTTWLTRQRKRKQVSAPENGADVTESAEDKTPARERITEYALEHFRYFRTPDGSPYAQRMGHPIARPLKSQGVAGSHRQELMLDMFHGGLGLFSGTAM